MDLWRAARDPLHQPVDLEIESSQQGSGSDAGIAANHPNRDPIGSTPLC
jgi:hypothetical protein